MGVFGDVWGVVTGRSKAVPVDFANQLVQSLGRTGRPPLRGTAELLAAYSTLPRLRAVVDRIAGSVAAVPWKAHRVRGGGSRTQILSALRSVDPGVRQRELKYLSQGEELEPLPGHPALDFINRRNPMMSGSQIRQMIQIHLDIVGESFAIIERSMRNWPTELWPLPPHWAKRLPTPDQPTYDFRGPNWFPGPVAKDDVLWIRHPDPHNPYARGTGIGRSLANELDADEYAAQTASHRFFNQGTPETIISLEGMQDASAQAFQQRLANEARGFRKVARPFVTNAKLNVQKLSADFVDLDLVALREFEAGVFRETFGIPPEILGSLENSNRATIHVAEKHYAMYVLVPRLSMLEETINDLLVPQFGDPNVVLLYENPDPSDWDFSLQAATAFPYAFNIDELREFAGKPPMTDGSGELHPLPFAISFGPLVETDTSADTAPATDNTGDNTGKVWSDDEEETEAEKAWHLKDGRSAQIADAADADDLSETTKKVWSDQLGRWIDRESGRFSSVDVEHLKQLAVRHVEQFGGDRMDQVNQSTKRRLRKELAEGIRGGETPEELADRVRGVYKTASDSRALMIAKTEVARSSNWASREVQKAGGVTRREWVAQPDARDAHAEMDGQEVGIDEAFVAPSGERTMYPGGFGVAELDVNCFVPDTQVQGTFFAGLRAEYRGKVVHIQTAGGRRLTVTPNHPVLTPNGFVAARLLRQGQQLICHSDHVDGGSAHPSDQQHAEPVAIAHVYDLLSKEFPTAGRRNDVEDLHGDGANVVDHHIDIVGPEWKLLSDDRAADSDLIGKVILETAPVQELSVSRNGTKHLGVPRVLRSSSGLPSAGQLAFLGFAGDGTPFDATRIGSASHIHASRYEVSGDAVPGETEFVAQLLERGARSISFDHVVEVFEDDFSGHVYDLQSDGGWLVGNGIVCSNCRCSVRPIKSKATRRAEWKQHDKHARPWVKAAEKALRAGFKAQESQVLAKLRHVMSQRALPASTEVRPTNGVH